MLYIYIYITRNYHPNSESSFFGNCHPKHSCCEGGIYFDISVSFDVVTITDETSLWPRIPPQLTDTRTQTFSLKPRRSNYSFSCQNMIDFIVYEACTIFSNSDPSSEFRFVVVLSL
jgi:hypothetical protein